VTSDEEEPNSDSERETDYQYMNQREEIEIMKDDTVPKKNKKGKKLRKSESISVSMEFGD